MEEHFDAYERDLEKLKPQVKTRAVTITAELQQEGWPIETALQEGIKRAELEFLSEEG